jgi:tRNA (adenine57-N1/adenine58-N1)-methyltransferase
MSGRHGPLVAGERALLVDEKGRNYHLLLDEGKQFQSHLGMIPHTDLIGCEEGSTLKSSDGAEFLLFRPATADFVVKMGRPTNILYPKDVGLILALTGIGAGSHVVEAGTGSGSGTIALLRAVGAEGSVTSYELRPEFLPNARRNIEGVFGSRLPGWLNLKEGDVSRAIEERDVDAVILDLPEPWGVVGPAAQALRPGGFFVAFVPTTVQLEHVVRALDAHGSFALVNAIESLVRQWRVRERSVRPAHSMVGHTGFLVFARRLLDPEAGG